jgi:hypothetical protein
VNESGGVFIFLSDQFGEFLDERDGDVAGKRGLCGELLSVELIRLASRSDNRRVRGSNYSRFGLGAGKRRLELEQALNVCYVGKNPIDRFLTKQLVEESHRCDRLPLSAVKEYRFPLALQAHIPFQSVFVLLRWPCN